MGAKEKELAQAAASLTVEDFEYLKEHSMIPPAEAVSKPNTQGGNTQEETNTPAVPRAAVKRKRRRRTLEHQWPEPGTLLQADYEGVHYEAQVIVDAGSRSQRTVKILSGPAAGRICGSPTGAMMEATEQQRQQANLGKKGVANGWEFWKTEPAG